MPSPQLNNSAAQVMRVMLTVFVAVFMLALYAGREGGQQLSADAQEYQTTAEMIAYSGFSPGLLVGVLLWLGGTALGILGVVLLFVRKRIGLTLFVCGFALLPLGVPFASPEEAYPFVISYWSIMLWCACSAAWSAVCVYAFGNRAAIFTIRKPEAG
jgi:hypothetical protein